MADKADEEEGRFGNRENRLRSPERGDDAFQADPADLQMPDDMQMDMQMDPYMDDPMMMDPLPDAMNSEDLEVERWACMSRVCDQGLRF